MQHSNDEQDKDVTISELEIKVATPVMSGNYSCEVSNNAGTAQSGKVCLTVCKLMSHRVFYSCFFVSEDVYTCKFQHL